jgi:hypothetical protein
MIDNQRTSKSGKIVAIIFSLFVLMTSIIIITDLIQLYHNPNNYEIVYKKSNSDINWKTDYILKGVIIIVFCFITLGLSIWRLFNPQKWIRVLTNVFYILITLTLILGYYKWYLTGFDHP